MLWYIRQFLCFLSLFGFLSLSSQSDIDHWETVVSADDLWLYRLGTSAPPVNWREPNFDDSEWEQGVGGIGYGDDDDGTVVGPVTSVILRMDFEILDTSNISMAVFHADYDDSFIAFLNGTEIGRGNIGDPNLILGFDESPPIDQEAVLYAGGLPEAYPLYPLFFDNIIQEGQNTLAIQVNNFGITSSDLSSNFFFSLGITDSSQNYEPTPDWFFEPFFSTNLPLIRINTLGQSIVDDPRIVANMKIIDNGIGETNFLDDPPTDYDGQIAIEIRGASSQFFNKKNFGFETQDEFGENNNVSLLDMPAENDWILHGPYSDKSLIRNALTFEIGNDVMNYASRTRFCELMINNQYTGVYLLMEKIKEDENRVDIATLNSDDIEGDDLTGGYIFQIDRDNPDVDGVGWYSSFSPFP
ncbi:MAG: CotH kinase family protein, partial [Crocinitomicaceae bacterium]|nr:CotH kinase family protein [Crocinitomicaceae bacterium]